MTAATVGFDLDLTLIDPRPGMIAVFDRLRDEFGVPVDGEHFAANLGPPLPDVLRTYGFDEQLVHRLVARSGSCTPTSSSR